MALHALPPKPPTLRELIEDCQFGAARQHKIGRANARHVTSDWQSLFYGTGSGRGQAARVSLCSSGWFHEGLRVWPKRGSE
jgi:hypothetical protein